MGNLRRNALIAGARVLAVSVAVVLAYVTAPLGRPLDATVAGRLALSLLLLVALMAWQIRGISRSPHPTLRGVEAVAVCVPLLVLAYAAAYFGTDQTTPGSFNEPLSRFDAVYFSVTVLTTVGFGDIAPLSGAARVMVTSQMLVDLVLGGLIAKVLVGAVRRRSDHLERESAPV